MMSLVVLVGAQAVGKMTVGKELEKIIAGKLLFNHQTIDLFANFLGYNHYSFELSDLTRKALFKAFIKNKEANVTPTIIFTVMIAFDQIEDIAFLDEISRIFLEANEEVYIIELVADIEERLARNRHESRLLAKPSKRDLLFSEKDLLSSLEKYRLESRKNELDHLFPKVKSLKIDTTFLAPLETAELIVETFQLK